MKNYYEILEVSENASQEVIEKAYKALAKKYHPDVQSPEKIKWAEEKFKEISEAYEVLSNEDNKSQYDLEFENSKQLENSNDNYNDNYEELLSQNEELEREVHNLKSIQKKHTQSNNIIDERESDEAFNDAINKAYHDAYIQRLKDYGYRIKYKKSLKTRFKNFISLILTLIIIFVILYILWHIPSVKAYFVNFYNNNNVLQFFGKILFK